MPHHVHVPFSCVALAVLLCAGCGVFHDSVESAGVTETTFDDTLPSTLESVFAACSDPLVLNDSTSQIELLSGCDYGDMSGVAEQTLYLGLATMGPIGLAGSIFPPELSTALNDIYLVEGFDFPIQNCKIFVELVMDFGRVQLSDLRAD